MTRLLLAPAERAEILVDLSSMYGQSFELKSYGASLPRSAYGVSGLATMMGGSPPGYNSNTLNGSNFTLLDINVGPQTNNNPVFSIPNILADVNPLIESDATVTRSLTIQAPDMMNDGVTGPFQFNGQSFDMNVINQTVQLGDTEIWEIFNMSMVAHPFHIHDVQFYILDRDGFAPPENESGRKDVVLVKQMETVRFIAKFEDFADDELPYMYHCHMLQHEDDGLMGQFIVEGNPLENTNVVIMPSYFEIQDINRMSAFADYIVPVALRLFGIINYVDELDNAINKGKEIPESSTKEVEIRAHSLYATAILTGEINKLRPDSEAIIIPQLDWRLWKTYHATHWPHHLTKTIMY